jgi:DMSO/TMAO reductase YedYZ molybdopterin-dependent catalytic subunit
VNDEKPSRSSRRRFLFAAALLAGGGAGGVVWTFTKDTPDHWDRVVPFLTEQPAFYSRYEAKKRDPKFWWVKLTRPALFPDKHPPLERWSLRLDGEVYSEVEVDDAEVRALADQLGSVSLLRTLRCAGDRPDNRLASNAVWTGLPLAHLIRRARPKSTAKRIRLYGDDGFTASLRLSYLQERGGRPPLLAYAVNGEPMEHERGGPVRLVMPDRYGFKNIKWPRRMEFTSDDSLWGWNPTAETTARDLTLRGVAFGGQSPVKTVDVRVGDGAWRSAVVETPEELTSDPLVRAAVERLPERGWPLGDVWTHWTIGWSAPGPGEYEVRVRVTNAAGETQPETDIITADGWSQQATGRIVIS